MSRMGELLQSGYGFSSSAHKKLFLSVPGGGRKEKFLLACFVFSCPAKSSFTVSEEAEKVFDFGNGGKFLFHFADGII